MQMDYLLSAKQLGMDGGNMVSHDQRTLAEMMNDSSINRVMAIDLNWNIIAWNKTSETISGIHRSNILGKNLLDAFPQILNDQEMLHAINMAFEGYKSFLPANYKTFNRQYYENHFIPLKNDHEEVFGVMNIMHDVAHRIKAEKQLQKLNSELEKKYRQLEKANNELATFTYITSRDIKEPLKHVYTSLELLVKKEGFSLSNMSKGNLRRMQGSLNKMNLLLDDILAVSEIRTNAEPLSDVDLNKVLQDSIKSLKQKIDEKNAVIESENLPHIRGYERMLDYLFLNIIDNGLKFQEDNSIPTIRISSSKATGDEVANSELTPEKEYIKISFSDNGIGFPREDTARIFVLFEKLNERRFHGSGVGLTISKKIMEAHEGILEAESSPGSGSVFHCYFPVNRDE
jgi:PAS domain S-box-containing protein